MILIVRVATNLSPTEHSQFISTCPSLEASTTNLRLNPCIPAQAQSEAFQPQLRALKGHEQA